LLPYANAILIYDPDSANSNTLSYWANARRGAGSTLPVVHAVGVAVHGVRDGRPDVGARPGGA
jgi:hypothetical protein